MCIIHITSLKVSICWQIFTHYFLYSLLLPGIPYEITTYTSNISSAGTDADVYVVLYGQDAATSHKSLCPSGKERKKRFGKGQVDRFVIEVRVPLVKLLIPG